MRVPPEFVNPCMIPIKEKIFLIWLILILPTCLSNLNFIKRENKISNETNNSKFIRSEKNFKNNSPIIIDGRQ